MPGFALRRFAPPRVSGDSPTQENIFPRLFNEAGGSEVCFQIVSEPNRYPLMSLEAIETANRGVSSDAALLAWAGLENALNVVIVYEDSLTRELATDLWGRVTNLIGEDSIHLGFWKFADLTDVALFPQAVRHAIEADVIIVSVRAATELPRNLYLWVDAWLPRRRLSSGALAALIGIPDQQENHSDRICDYLASVARRASMDFLPRERRLPAQPAPLALDDSLNDRAHRITPLLGEILDRPHDSYSDWGINE
jgi:hypothetical protein